MRILGIQDGVSAGAAILDDGKIVAVVSEERLDRRKMSTGFPEHSIRECLKLAGLRAGDVDRIAVANRTGLFKRPAFEYPGWFSKREDPRKKILFGAAALVSRRLLGYDWVRRAAYRLRAGLFAGRRPKLFEVLRGEFGFTCPIEFVDHHLAHAASAYFTSGLDDALVLTLDGAGDECSSHVYAVCQGSFELKHKVDSFNSLGNYYGYVTHLLGFKAHRHEGKITGLAAYGKPSFQDRLRRLIRFREGTIENTGRVFNQSALAAIRRLLPKDYKNEDVAASIQGLLEEIALAYIRHWVVETGLKDLALAGGVFANVKLNQRIHELECVRTLFIHPGMGDEGLALGAALMVVDRLAREAGTRVKPERLKDVYFGPAYTNREIEKAVRDAGVQAEYAPDIEDRIAKLLAQGKVVARFAGRMEYGPRALGNRSVLYQATDPTVNDWLNKRFNRTEFMPFAPVTLDEHAEKCYVNLDGSRYPARFMTITFDCTDWMKEHCPAVVHVDGTARPQIITRESNPSYYRILERYYELTGLPSIINTSFNMHEEPIVCSPQDAIRSFQQGSLDYLALENWLVSQ
ncbi:MAG: carbamoyltransferase [Candidatus Omnitrophica bacterium]|nr:carbamoyltransferase [Candidatus Omnitrophota bacterium]